MIREKISEGRDPGICKHGNFKSTCKSCAESEANRLIVELVDARNDKEGMRVQEFHNLLEASGVISGLQKFQKGFSDLCRGGNNLKIKLIDGGVADLGSGEAKGINVEISLLSDANLTEAMKPLKKMFPDIPDEISREIGMRIIASTVLHEGVHSFLESKPGTAFHSQVELISGEPDPDAMLSTLCDEAIAYAVQSIFAQEIEPVGSLSPRVREGDSELVAMRKELGILIRKDVEDVLEGRLDVQGVLSKLIKEARLRLQ